MGRVHTEAIRRVGNVDVVAVAAHTLDEAKAFAQSVGIETATAD